MNATEFFEEYFPAITLVVVILLAIFIIAAVFNLNFQRKKNQKLTKKVTFNPNI
jgi:hypothetical protein